MKYAVSNQLKSKAPTVISRRLCLSLKSIIFRVWELVSRSSHSYSGRLFKKGPISPSIPREALMEKRERRSKLARCISAIWAQQEVYCATYSTYWRYCTQCKKLGTVGLWALQAPSMIEADMASNTFFKGLLRKRGPWAVLENDDGFSFLFLLESIYRLRTFLCSLGRFSFFFSGTE